MGMDEDTSTENRRKLDINWLFNGMLQRHKITQTYGEICSR